MKLITKLRITALTTLVVLVYLAGNIREGEASYTCDGSDLVVTVRWLNDNYYRVYLNDRDNPTNDNYIEVKYNPSLLFYPSFDYNKTTKDSLFILELSTAVQNIHTPDFAVVYSTTQKYCPDGNNIILMNYTSADSLSLKITDVRWHLRAGDRHIKISNKDKMHGYFYKKSPEVIIFDRHDKSSE